MKDRAVEFDQPGSRCDVSEESEAPMGLERCKIGPTSEPSVAHLALVWMS